MPNSNKPEPEEDQDTPEYLTLKQVATALNVTGETIRKYRKTQNLPVVRIGGVLRSPKKAFIEWCKKRPRV